MKQKLFLVALFVTFIAQAQEKPFEGIIVQKVLTSYSDEVLKTAEHLTPGRDTLITYIKGDVIHNYQKCLGIHTIYADGKIYVYSDNTREGYSIPERQASKEIEGLKEIIKTNETRTILGYQCSINKILLLTNNTTIELESWQTDNFLHLSDRILQILFPDAEGELCLKSSFCIFMTGNMDAVTKFSKSLVTKEQREAAWGSIRKEATEISTSKISEVIEIKEMVVDDILLRPASNILIKDYTIEDIVKEPPFDTEVFKKVYLATPGLSKEAKKEKNVNRVMEGQAEFQRKLMRKVCSDPNYKTKGIVPKDLAKSERKSVDDLHRMNMNFEDAMYWQIYPIKLNQLLRRNNAYLREHNKLQENIKPVAYDLDEEWDF